MRFAAKKCIFKVINQVVIINYRLAPEHPFPAAVEDAYTAYQWLIEDQKIAPNNLVIPGVPAPAAITPTPIFSKLRP